MCRLSWGVCLALALLISGCGDDANSDANDGGVVNLVDDDQADGSTPMGDVDSGRPDESIAVAPADLPTSTGCDELSAQWPSDWVSLETAVLQLVNERRASMQDCGSAGRFSPVPPLEGHPLLDCAARRHSLDMAQRGFFDHINPDGEAPDARILVTGYQPRAMGENIAAGAMTAEDVVEGWMNSDGHCRNIMNGSFQQLGVGYIFDADVQYNRYWTQVFGTERN
ncbi:MAG: CAP domain-containing protein [Myxococcota bacterium]|nr:CAP domain-containing protein [Myxococcota bacterium]